MPRKARNIYQGEYYHIISRGNARQVLFREEEDFKYFLQHMVKYKEKFRVSMFHYCLMSNHVHMLMRSDADNEGITRLMHGVQMVYARYFKMKRRKTGHVFEDRFKHFHIQSEAYLLECGRYIERNPLRAGIVKRVGEYPWSSYGYYAYKKRDNLLTENVLFQGLGVTGEDRQAAYRHYVETPRAYENIIDQYFEERVLI